MSYVLIAVLIAAAPSAASPSITTDDPRCTKPTEQEKRQLIEDLEQLAETWKPYESRYFETLQAPELPARVQSLGTPDAAFVAMGLRHHRALSQCQTPCDIDAIRGSEGAFDDYAEAYPDHLPIRFAALGACPRASEESTAVCLEAHAKAMVHYAPEDAFGWLLLATVKLTLGDQPEAIRLMHQAARAETVDRGVVQMLRIQSEVLKQILPAPLPDEPASLRPSLAGSVQGWMHFSAAGLAPLAELKESCLAPNSDELAEACLAAADAMVLPLGRLLLARYAHEIRIGIAEYRGAAELLERRIDEMARFEQLPSAQMAQVRTEDDLLRIMTELAQYGEYHSYLNYAAACEKQ